MYLYIFCDIWCCIFKQGVALTGCNRSGPPCSVGRPHARRPSQWWPTAHEPSPAAGCVTTTDNRCQRAKQYWPVRRASNKKTTIQYSWGGGDRSGTVGGRSPRCFFWVLPREALQSQTHTEKILHNASR